MKKFIITISREFGCNAREVGHILASKLDVPFYDRDLVDMTAQRAGISSDSFIDSEMLLDRHLKELLKAFSYGSSTPFYSEKAVMAQVDVIRELADKRQSCIFFGRCSDYILREYPNCLNIFLYAPLDHRIQHMSEAYDLTEAAAAKLIKRVDLQRHNYYKYVTGKNRGDRDNKHIMLDVSNFGCEGTADIIISAVNRKYGE
ncbi:MAG: cytidylate kinase-like family protein [Oscillospiraceae bacterium]|nr:cytidylate kinase-like family protein [Oscillospiraceae bacterium]